MRNNMKSYLILIIILLTFYVTYVRTISCYVCNSEKDKDCDHISETSNYLKNCSVLAKEKYDLFMNAMKDGNPDHKNFGRFCHFCKLYRNGSRFSQCSKTTLDLKDDSGNKVERVIRGCSGMACKVKDCYYGRHPDTNTKSQVCHCNEDKCNSSHRRVHQNNICANILLTICICFAFAFNQFYA